MDYESKSEFFHRPKFSQLFERKKIIVRRVSGENNRLISVYDDDQFYSNDNLIHLILWDDEIIELQSPDKIEVYKPYEKFPLDYLAGIIGSKLISYFFNKNIATGTLQGTYSGVYPEDVREIPIKMGSKEQKDELSNLVKQIVPLNKTLNKLKIKKSDELATIEDQINETDKAIDELVYKIYGITENEKKIIEKSFENS